MAGKIQRSKSKKLSATERLAESNEPYDWVKAARRKTCKLHTLEKIIEKSEAYRNKKNNSESRVNPFNTGHLDFYICCNPNVSEEILLSKIREYGLDKNPHSRSYLLSAILRNASTTRKVLENLASAEVLMHPQCPENKMVACAESGSRYEQLYLATNPSLPCSVQRKLAESLDRKIRQKLATNNFLDDEIIVLLSDDPSPIVVRNLIQNSCTSTEQKALLTKKLKEIGRGRINKVTLARHSSNSEDLKEYIQDDDYFVASYALRNENFSTEHAELGCGHKYKNIRNMSKNHEKCSETGKIIAALMD